MGYSYPLNCHNHRSKDSPCELTYVKLKYYANNRRDLEKQYPYTFFMCDLLPPFMLRNTAIPLDI